MAQGYPWVLALICGLSHACEGLPLARLGPGLWWLPAAASESEPANRGHAAHVLLARDGRRLWAVGSGATPVIGQRLRCTAEKRLGGPVTDLLVPWAVAELTLGTAGLGPVRAWAHQQVAEAMTVQCPHCVERLRQRLGDAASDLGPDPVRMPTLLLQGDSGSLGPFDWWVLPRSDSRVATVLRHRASGVVFAPGLLWGDGPVDLRDTDVPTMARSLAALPALVPGAGRWIGQTGALMDARSVAAQAAYVGAMATAAAAAAASGELQPIAPDLPGADHPRHALNWQRAWRQAEDDWLRRR